MQNQQTVPLVAILDSNETDAIAIRRVLAESNRVHVVGAVREASQIPQLMASYPDIVLVDVEQLGDDITHIINQIHDHSPRCQVILMTIAGRSLDLHKAMRAGARGLIQKPIVPKEMVDYVLEVHETEERRFNRIEEVAKARATQGRAGEIITIFSAKGGVGCTVLATNLAIALAMDSKARVALVDFSLQFGDTAVLLNLRSTHGVHELMRSIDELDNAILDDVMVQHSSGIRVLLPPPRFEQVEDIDTDGMVAVLKALKKYYDYIVVDTWHSVEEATLGIMDQSGILLVVTTPEVPALRNTKRLLDVLKERPELRGKVQVIVNRFPSKSAVEMKDIESSLGQRPMGAIASDGRTVTASINEGVAVLTMKSAVTTSVHQLAAQLIQRTPQRGVPTSQSQPTQATTGKR